MKRLGVPLVVLLVGALVVYGLGRYDAALNDREAAHQARVEEALRTAKPFHQRDDSLRAAAALDSARIAQLEAQVAPLQIANRALRQQVEAHRPSGVVPVVLVDSIIMVAEVRDSLRVATISRLWALVETEKARADSAVARVLTLEAVLRQDPGRCRFLILLPCPSRTTALLVGGAAGAIGMAVASR